MTRLIKRYGNRKLYDTSESRYVLLEDISLWIREGEDVRVVDNATSEDVTAQTLTQVISEESRKRSQFLSSDLLHDLIRAGGSAVSNKVKQISTGVDRFMKRSINRLAPISKVRDEMTHLKERLEELEKALAAAEAQGSAEAGDVKKKAPKTANKGSKSNGARTGRSKQTKPVRKTTAKPKTKKAVAAKNAKGTTKKRATAQKKAG